MPSHAQMPGHAPRQVLHAQPCKPSGTKKVPLTPQPETRRQYGDDSCVTQSQSDLSPPIPWQQYATDNPNQCELDSGYYQLNLHIACSNE